MRNRPVVVIEGRPGVARGFVRACVERDLAYVTVARDAVGAALDQLRPWLVIDPGSLVAIDDVEVDPARHRAIHVGGGAEIARRCAARGIPLVVLSSAQVFDGRKPGPYHETDAPMPLSELGRIEADAEAVILGAHPGAIVLRTGALFGAGDAHDFVAATWHALAAGGELCAAADHVVSGTYLPELVSVGLDLAIDGEAGRWHLTHPEVISWAELARAAASHAGATPDRVCDVAADQLAWRAPRPPNAALATSRGLVLRPLDAALADAHAQWIGR